MLERELQLAKSVISPGSLVTRGRVIQFFDLLSHNRVSEAFSMVSDNLKWWAPTEVLLNVTKRSMMGRLDEATKQGTKFDMMELVSGASKVAAKVS